MDYLRVGWWWFSALIYSHRNDYIIMLPMMAFTTVGFLRTSPKKISSYAVLSIVQNVYAKTTKNANSWYDQLRCVNHITYHFDLFIQIQIRIRIFIGTVMWNMSHQYTQKTQKHRTEIQTYTTQYTLSIRYMRNKSISFGAYWQLLNINKYIYIYLRHKGTYNAFNAVMCIYIRNVYIYINIYL